MAANLATSAGSIEGERGGISIVASWVALGIGFNSPV
jgi:hypothetical protein